MGQLWHLLIGFCVAMCGWRLQGYVSLSYEVFQHAALAKVLLTWELIYVCFISACFPATVPEVPFRYNHIAGTQRSSLAQFPQRLPPATPETD
jgi:hypothetical protein